MAIKTYSAVYHGINVPRCDYQGLMSAPYDLGRDIGALSFRHDGLEGLSKHQFSLYTARHELRIAKKRMNTVHQGALHGLQILQILDLGVNLLPVDPSASFRHLSSLRILILRKFP